MKQKAIQEQKKIISDLRGFASKMQSTWKFINLIY
jgi:hypothetical protein